MARYTDSDDLKAACAAAAGPLGLLPEVIEKDYWVTQALRALHASHRDEFIFKGGTSLSKAFGLIERFSEDIDVLVLADEGNAKNARYKRLKRMSKSAAAALNCTPINIRSNRQGLHRTDRLDYDDIQPPRAMLGYVRLELGIHGGIEPYDYFPVDTLVGQALAAAGNLDPENFDDLKSFPVPVLHPGRTLIEKLILSNTVAEQAGEDPNIAQHRIGRHYYDIHCLLDHDPVYEVLEDRETFDAVVADAHVISDAHYNGALPRPADGFAAGAAFAPDGPLRDAIEEEYETAMSTFYFGADPHPSFANILARVQAAAKYL